jgi:hypothetical protein
MDVVDIKRNLNTLKEASERLNTNSDELGKIVIEINEVLKTLNLGISVWYKQSEGQDWCRSIGYARVGGKWGISLKYETFKDNVRLAEESWAFNEAPRYMRIEVISSIPDLIILMIQRTNEFNSKIVSKVNEAHDYLQQLKEK